MGRRAQTDATTVLQLDPNKAQSRRQSRYDDTTDRVRVDVLPPEGFGDMWNGSAR